MKKFIFLVIVLILGYFAFFKYKAQAPVVNNDWQNGAMNDTIGFHPCGTDPGANDCMSEEQYSSILGNKEDLIAFSVWPGAKVSGIKSYRGTIQGGYFFEANIRINILDANKNVLKASNAVGKGDWMTSGPVEFEGNIDFSNLPKGAAYFEIHNDNASDLPENDKSILIPIVIE